VQDLKQFHAVVPPSKRGIRVQKQVWAWLFVHVAVQNVPWVGQAIPLVTPDGHAFAAPASDPGAPPVPPSPTWQFSQARRPF
jgi:hypothetical protein